jgi:hypothetical protein
MNGVKMSRKADGSLVRVGIQGYASGASRLFLGADLGLPALFLCERDEIANCLVDPSLVGCGAFDIAKLLQNVEVSRLESVDFIKQSVG